MKALRVFTNGSPSTILACLRGMLTVKPVRSTKLRKSDGVFGRQGLDNWSQSLFPPRGHLLLSQLTNPTTSFRGVYDALENSAALAENALVASKIRQLAARHALVPNAQLPIHFRPRYYTTVGKPMPVSDLVRDQFTTVYKGFGTSNPGAGFSTSAFDPSRVMKSPRSFAHPDMWFVSGNPTVAAHYAQPGGILMRADRPPGIQFTPHYMVPDQTRRAHMSRQELPGHSTRLKELNDSRDYEAVVSPNQFPFMRNRKFYRVLENQQVAPLTLTNELLPTSVKPTENLAAARNRMFNVPALRRDVKALARETRANETFSKLTGLLKPNLFTAEAAPGTLYAAAQRVAEPVNPFFR